MTLVAFVWIVEFLTAYLNKEFEDVSMSLVFAGIMMALIVGNRSQYSAESMKFQAVFTAFNSISFMLSPKVSLKTWKMPTSSLNDPVAVSMASDIGRWLGALSIMQLFLAFGGDAMTGFAYARLAILARYLLVNFVTNEANKMGMKKSQQMFWILYNAVVAAALLLM